MKDFSIGTLVTYLIAFVGAYLIVEEIKKFREKGSLTIGGGTSVTIGQQTQPTDQTPVKQDGEGIGVVSRVYYN